MGRGFKRTIIVFEKGADGSVKSREITAEEHTARQQKKIPYANGLSSLTVGAATSREAKRMEKEFARAGLKGLSFNDQNDLVFENKRAKNEYCRWTWQNGGRKIIDTDGGYGDFVGE